MQQFSHQFSQLSQQLGERASKLRSSVLENPSHARLLVAYALLTMAGRIVWTVASEMTDPENGGRDA